MNKMYSDLTFYGILFIAFIHLVGFLSLQKWLEFSGIGSEATRLEEKYGSIAPILLNVAAMILFIILAIIYQLRNEYQILQILALTTVMIFVLRGVVGYIMTTIGKTGTATPFWEVIFSSLSLVIGIAGILGLGGK